MLLGRGEDVDLGRPALLVHHDAGGGDFGDATQLMLEVRVPSIHHMPTLPGRGGADTHSQDARGGTLPNLPVSLKWARRVPIGLL